MLLQGILMVLLFFGIIYLVMRGLTPIVGLLIMAIGWPALAGAPLTTILNDVVQKGVENFASAALIIVFGAWFGQILVQTGIAESLIRNAVELGGDRPLLVSILISLVTGVLFTSVYGVGAAIAVGVIALPIMLTLGVPRWVAAAAFTMPIGAANYLNLVEFGVFKKLFPGISYEGQYLRFYGIAFGVYLLLTVLMLVMTLRKSKLRSASALLTQQGASKPRVPIYALLAPIIPVLLVMLLKWPIIPAFIVGILFALIATPATRHIKAAIDLFQKTMRDAFPDVALVAGLWMMCGMLVQAGQLPAVSAALKPLFAPILPQTPLTAVLFFAVLAPLALYRGPFSVIGTGAALLSVMLSAGTINPIFLYCVWRGALTLQSSQDPTNSWVLWTTGYTKVSHKEFLSTALPWGWAMVAVNAAIAYFMIPH